MSAPMSTTPISTPTSSTMSSTPRPVTIFGTLALFLGGIALAAFSVLVLFALMGICGGGPYTASGGPGSPATEIGVILLGISLLGVVAALGMITLGIGTLAQQRWAWWATVSVGGVLALAGVVAFVYSLLTQTATVGSSIWEPLLIVIGGVILAYALSPSVRGTFGIDIGERAATRTLQPT